MNRTILAIAIAVLFVAVAAAPVAAIPAVRRLVSPTLLLPSNNAEFTNSAHLVMLEWKPVTDSRLSDYLIEVEGWAEPWDLWMGFTSIPRITTATYYQVSCGPAYLNSLEGYHSYRWRVTARSSVGGCDSAPSKWQYFSFPYTEPDVRLATVRPVSPDNKIVFSNGTAQSYAWNIVPGADQYLLIHERMNANNFWGTAGGSPMWILGVDPDFPLVIDYASYIQWMNPGTFRWRVIAVGMGTWSASPWRTYTVV